MREKIFMAVSDTVLCPSFCFWNTYRLVSQQQPTVRNEKKGKQKVQMISCVSPQKMSLSQHTTISY